MSKDSSSDIQEELVQISPVSNIFKALLTIIAVTFGFLATQFIGAVLFFSIALAVGLDTDQIQRLLADNAWIQFAAMFVIQTLTVGLVYLYIKVSKRNFFSYLKLKNKPNAKILGSVAVTYLLYFIAFIVIAIMAENFVPSLDTEQMQQIGFENTKGLDYLAVFAALVILPPIAEEIVFRGILFQMLKQYTSLIIATLLSSVIFGLAHLEFFSDAPLNWIAALDTFVFSIFLTVVYVKTKSLWAPIMLHALKNGIAFVFLFLI